MSLSLLALGIRGKMFLVDRLPLGDSLPNPPLYVLTEFSRISEETNSMVLNGSQTDVSEGTERLWSFAGREFDESRLELRVNGKPVELELKPLEILVQLLLHAGEIVTKDELLDAVWPRLTVVEGSLSTAIYKLRKALGDEESTIVLTDWASKRVMRFPDAITGDWCVRWMFPPAAKSGWPGTRRPASSAFSSLPPAQCVSKV